MGGVRSMRKNSVICRIQNFQCLHLEIQQMIINYIELISNCIHSLVRFLTFVLRNAQVVDKRTNRQTNKYKYMK